MRHHRHHNLHLAYGRDTTKGFGLFRKTYEMKRYKTVLPMSKRMQAMAADYGAWKATGKLPWKKARKKTKKTSSTRKSGAFTKMARLVGALRGVRDGFKAMNPVAKDRVKREARSLTQWFEESRTVLEEAYKEMMRAGERANAALVANEAAKAIKIKQQLDAALASRASDIGKLKEALKNAEAAYASVRANTANIPAPTAGKKRAKSITVGGDPDYFDRDKRKTKRKSKKSGKPRHRHSVAALLPRRIFFKARIKGSIQLRPAKKTAKTTPKKRSSKKRSSKKRSSKKRSSKKRSSKKRSSKNRATPKKRSSKKRSSKKRTSRDLSSYAGHDYY